LLDSLLQEIHAKWEEVLVNIMNLVKMNISID